MTAKNIQNSKLKSMFTRKMNISRGYNHDFVNPNFPPKKNVQKGLFAFSSYSGALCKESGKKKQFSTDWTCLSMPRAVVNMDFLGCASQNCFLGRTVLQFFWRYPMIFQRLLEVRFYMNGPSKWHAAISSKQFFGFKLHFQCSNYVYLLKFHCFEQKEYFFSI